MFLVSLGDMVSLARSNLYMKIVRPDGGMLEKEQILVGWRKTDEQMEPETAPHPHPIFLVTITAQVLCFRAGL